VESERAKVKTIVTVEKYRNEKDFLEGKPYKREESQHNILLNEGCNLLWTLACGGTGTPYDNANARVGVGDSNAGEDPAQTGLQGGNQLYKSMDSGYPTYGTLRKMVFKGTYGSAEANWHWLEYTVDNGSVAGVNINRKVADHGTKTSGEVWTLTITFTFA